MNAEILFTVLKICIEEIGYDIKHYITNSSQNIRVCLRNARVCIGMGVGGLAQ